MRYQKIFRKRMAIIITICLLGFLGYAVFLYIIKSENKIALSENEIHKIAFWGTVGDSFGVITSLFTVLAFIGVIYSLEEQREQFDKQNFETTFFNLLNLHNNILKDISIQKNQGTPKTGSDCFENFYKYFIERYDDNYKPQIEKLKMQNANILDIERSITKENRLNYIKAAYKELHKQHGSDIDHYFRTLYNIIKFIDAATIKDKEKYTNLVRAQLSNSEILLLFYNCLNYPKFQHLVESYAFFEDMPELTYKHHKDYYKNEAFGKED